MAIVRSAVNLLNVIYKKVPKFLWVCLLLFIPVTSFPLIARYTGYASVSPLSVVPLIFIILLWFIPYVFRRGRLPVIVIPILLFVVFAILSCLRAPFLEIYSYKGQSVTDREIRALITLFIGISFYLVASSFPKTVDDLRLSFRWIYIGAGIMFLWSTVQIFRLPYSFNPQPDSLKAFHSLFATTELFRYRVTGMAYEPSWLADQLTILYLPLWIGSVVKGYTVFNFKIWKIPIELFLLFWGSIILFFSYSRIGLLAFIATLAVLLVVRASRWVDQFAEKRSYKSRLPKRQLKIIYWILIITIFVVLVAGVLLLAIHTNKRIQGIFDIDYGSLQSERLPFIYNLINQLEYAERLMYWISSFLIFSRYPFLGIGLGNSGLLFRETVPAFGTYLPEVLIILGPVKEIVANPKSLWMRLLSETGIIGFILFISWLVMIGFNAFILNRRKKGMHSVLGLAGGLALIAFFFEGFSLDTFALPQIWIIFGLLSAASTISTRNHESTEQGL
jgi:hypothetical protein